MLPATSSPPLPPPNDGATELLHQAITSDAAAAATFAVATMYGLLCIGLAARVLQRICADGRASCKLSQGLLLGFTLYSGARSATLAVSAAVRMWSDARVMLPTAFFVFLLMLMLTLWDRFLARLEASSASTVGPRSRLACAAIPVVAAVTAVFIGLTLWGATAQHRPPAALATAIYAIDAALCVVCGAAFTAVGLRLRRLFADHDDYTELSSQAPAGARPRRCCLVALFALPLHIRAQVSAVLLGVFTACRGTAPLVNAVLGDRARSTNQQFILPAFYALEWAVLLLSLRLITGPPAAAASEGAEIDGGGAIDVSMPINDADSWSSNDADS